VTGEDNIARLIPGDTVKWEVEPQKKRLKVLKVKLEEDHQA
jgi:hypothetical protein